MVGINRVVMESITYVFIPILKSTHRTKGINRSLFIPRQCRKKEGLELTRRLGSATVKRVGIFNRDTEAKI